MATRTKSSITEKEQFSDLLLQVNNDLAITNTLDEALEALVGIATSIIQCERGTIFLNDPKLSQRLPLFSVTDFRYKLNDCIFFYSK